MSGRDHHGNQPLSNAMGKIKDKLIRSGQEEQGYHRVDSDGGTFSTSNTATSLDTILPDDPFSFNIDSSQTRQISPASNFDPDDTPLQFKPIIEGDDITEPPVMVTPTKVKKFVGSSDLTPLPPPPTSYSLNRDGQRGPAIGQPSSADDIRRSKQSLKGSRVSFEKKTAESSDEDSFEEKRAGYQKQKTVSMDHKGILKDLKNMLANDNRRQFQAKKHVSLDIKGTRFLQDILKESSSEEEFRKNRKEFQGRKHQSLDPRVTFKLERVLQGSSTDSDEEGDDVEHKRLIYRPKDITKPVIIDLKEFDSESEEDYVTTRQNFQQQRSISTDSKKSLRFMEMNEIGKKRSENLRRSIPYIRQITEDGKPKLEVYRPTTNPIYIWTQPFPVAFQPLNATMGDTTSIENAEQFKSSWERRDDTRREYDFQ